MLLNNLYGSNWLQTINHNNLGLSYFFFTLITAIMGSYFATCISMEMAYPGSSFFNGDSLNYLQVITAHAIIMIFFVVVPIFFGGFANYLLPYHVGSNDVAYPSLNNLGFWIQPCGFLLISNMGSMSLEFWTSRINTSFYFTMNEGTNFLQNYVHDEVVSELSSSYSDDTLDFMAEYIHNNCEDLDNEDPNYLLLQQQSIESLSMFEVLALYPSVTWDKVNSIFYSYKLWFWNDFYNSNSSLWSLTNSAVSKNSQNSFLVKCINSSQTVAGWTFITPFSSNPEWTGFGIQDLLILGVYYAGISTTISVVNLLTTSSALSSPGLSSSRVLMPFISITNLLMLSALAIITPVLGSAMLMLLADSYWNTSFFDYSYGGDAIFFQHLFWFFGHPEVYVLIIPAFGIINSVLPTVNSSRVASNHHLIWAIYVMNYMGFLVWGHHMYLVGLDHSSSSLYSTITIMISLPATINVVNWTYTLTSGLLNNSLILYGIISFILFFLIAGLTGMWLSHVSLNISMHDSLYVVAHFHLMLSGSVMMGIFVGFYFYYTEFLQTNYSNNFSLIHVIYFSIGQWMTFIPMFWVAFSGLPSSVHDFPLMFIGWQSLSTSGHFITMIGVFAFYSTLFESTFDNNISTVSYNLIPSFYSYKVFIFFKEISLLIGKGAKNINVDFSVSSYVNNKTLA